MKSVLSPLRTYAAKPRNTYSAPRQSLPPSPPSQLLRFLSGMYCNVPQVQALLRLEGKQYWASLYKTVKCNQCESGSTLIVYSKNHMKRTHNALQGPARLGVNALRKTWLERLSNVYSSLSTSLHNSRTSLLHNLTLCRTRPEQHGSVPDFAAQEQSNLTLLQSASVPDRLSLQS